MFSAVVCCIGYTKCYDVHMYLCRGEQGTLMRTQRILGLKQGKPWHLLIGFGSPQTTTSITITVHPSPPLPLYGTSSFIDPFSALASFSPLAFALPKEVSSKISSISELPDESQYSRPTSSLQYRNNAGF